MKLYAGIDLHSTNNYQVLLDETGKIVYDKRLPNDIKLVLREYQQFEGIDNMVVESTYNGYWLVDGFMAAGYQVKWANPNAIQQYDGLKRTNDKSDARWLADRNRLGILKQGYIYSQEERGTRDLLRKRSQFSATHNTHFESGNDCGAADSYSLEFTTGVSQYLEDEDVLLAANSNLFMIQSLDQQIGEIEKRVLKKIRLKPAYKKLLEIDGIGKILALTIMLETGEISRFPQVGNYASYCRLVDSKRESNGKKKGEGNKKNGNL